MLSTVLTRSSLILLPRWIQLTRASIRYWNRELLRVAIETPDVKRVQQSVNLSYVMGNKRDITFYLET